MTTQVTQWRKKPVVITAVQINTQQDAELCPGICTGGRSCKSKGAPDGAWPHIHTLEGDHTWTPGDWCITGVKGERYFCKPDIFEQTYEPAHRQSAERGVVVGYIIPEMLNRKSEFEANGIVLHSRPSGMATMPLYTLTTPPEAGA